MVLSLAACGGSGTTGTTAAAVESTAAAGGSEGDAAAEAVTEAAGGIAKIAKDDLKVGFVYIGDENEGYTAAHYQGAWI